ncbi:hypothetical protein BP6252_00170 [Coleophoma cylindrospora]|uniref:Uncharacterized protein n=1 Tax=Coleophoma cylindrospora TaxID=1849047 RepID=A0A3D8SQR5_9HELO|nr:hypothetical protein BP6252_00170 [Coleophoma cylindrospora]
MSDHKGKGRAQPEYDADNNQPDGLPEASMFSKVVASASGLTRNAFAAPSGNELNAQAAATLANSGKGQPSGAATRLTERDLSAEQQHSSASLPGFSNAFRQDQSQEHIQKSENEFSSFLDGIDSFSPSQDFTQGPQEEQALDAAGANEKKPFDHRWGELWANQQYVNRSKLTRGRTKQFRISIAEQESRDGQEVLQLLSAPTTEELPTDPENEEVEWNLTVEQISHLRAMTRDLFPQVDSHKPIPSDHPLNLIPDFGASDVMMMPVTDMNTEESSVYASLNRESFKEQWEDVLTRYTDEVWGGLLPLVKEARKEIEQMSDTEQTFQQPKALRRLGAILGHLNAQKSVVRDG